MWRSMSLDTPSHLEFNGSGLRFAVIAARFNETLVDSLVDHTCQTLEAAGAVTPVIERVPGSAELPYAASALIEHSNFDAVIVIGVVIAGDTNHHNLIGDSTAIALQELSIRKQVPVINGVLVVNTLAQAEARAGEEINRGKEFALSALEMALFKNKWKTTNQ
jgi:6,7-dimethyl-8-ribityllumazine synthase